MSRKGAGQTDLWEVIEQHNQNAEERRARTGIIPDWERREQAREKATYDSIVGNSMWFGSCVGCVGGMANHSMILIGVGIVGGAIVGAIFGHLIART